MNLASTVRMRALALAVLAGIAALALLLVPPITQWPEYHHFADHRTFLGIPNFANVLSNLPFLRIGFLGMVLVLRMRTFLEGSERWPYFIFFLGITLTCFGSSYYHWNPNDQRLLWDRLPITMAFMGFFGAIIGERLGLRLARWLLPWLIVLGVASVLFWQRTGDLRPYVFVQFFPIVAIPLMLAWFPPRYNRTADFFVVLGFYIAAKLCELLDMQIFRAGGFISGHTLKHLLAAMAAYWLYRMLALRKPVASLPQTAAVAGGSA